jgi:uncharacterized protein (TIGR02285 family)
MKPILAVLLFLAASAAFAQVVTVVEFDHPPLAYQALPSKEAAGAEVAYLKALLTDLGYTPKFVFVPFPRVLLSLQDGTADIGSLLTQTPERAAVINFSAQPVFSMVPVIVVRKASALQQVAAPGDLKGLRLGFVDGQTLPRYLDKKDLTLDLVSGADATATNLKKLMSGRVDAVLDLNPTNVQLDLKAQGLAADVRVLPLPTAGTDFFVTASKKSKVSDAVLAGINKLLAAKKYDWKDFLAAELK